MADGEPEVIERFYGILARGTRSASRTMSLRLWLVWLLAYARWLKAPSPAQVSADEVEDPGARFYAIEQRRASNAKVKHELGLRFRRREWLGATK